MHPAPTHVSRHSNPHTVGEFPSSSTDGQARAREYCLRATSQLQQQHSSRHVTQTVDDAIAVTRSAEEPVSDDEAAYWREAHKWGGRP